MLPPTATDDDLVRALGSAPRATAAYFALLRRGVTGVPAIRQGLRDADAGVREQCCRLLDQLLVEDALNDLVAMLDDENARVRVAALHALSCDRCKQDSCRPAEASVLPPAMRLLAEDPDPHVRAMAVELVGRFAHGSAGAEAALVRSRDGDASPAVRKKAGWYAPGGTIHRKTRPR